MSGYEKFCDTYALKAEQEASKITIIKSSSEVPCFITGNSYPVKKIRGKLYAQSEGGYGYVPLSDLNQYGVEFN